jgi:glycogen(starch) synthase
MAGIRLKKEQEETVKILKRETAKPILFEIAWEVCNQVGGIYTVIRSKVPSMVEEWGENYCLIGPYFPQTASIEFEKIDNDDSIFAKVAYNLQSQGIDAYYGRWLVTGNPHIILVDFNQALTHIDSLKFNLWENHKISTLNSEPLVSNVIAFGSMVKTYIQNFVATKPKGVDVIVHFHEWMASTALLDLKRENVNIATVFTTHATMLGRYIAGNVDDFYEKLSSYNWEKEAKYYGIEAQATIERLSAQQCNVLTTVSEVTAKECEVFYGRTCDIILRDLRPHTSFKIFT